jgi:folate-binding protein YgfZ
MPRSPLAVGARDSVSVEVDGWTVAAAYDDPAREYAALRDSAALVDLAYRARVHVTGADRVEFLHGMLSNDVRRLGSGDGCAALVLTDQARVVAQCVVLALADAILLDARARAAARAVSALARYVVADDVELALDDTTHAIGVLGPGAVDALVRCGIAAPPSAAYAHALVDSDAGPVRVVRLPAPGAGGFACLVPRSAALAWWAAAIRAEVPAAGFTAFETLRVENGVPADDVDVGPDTLALEAPLEPAISFGKGCYLGQEVVERVAARGHVNRTLVPLVVEGAIVPRPGDVIAAAGRDVGRVTSAAWSWRLEQPVALGYVRREHAAAGSRVDVRAGAGPLPATVRTVPVA